MIDWEAEARKRAKSGHALFGASVIERTQLCPGWARLMIESNAPNRETEDGVQGQFAHALGERALRYERDTADFIGKEFQLLRIGGNRTRVIDEEMSDYVQLYVDRCRTRMGYRFIETRVDLSKFSPIPHQFGTADYGCIEVGRKYDILYVDDLKYGMEPVYVDNLPQTKTYALGFLEEFGYLFNIQKVVIGISQPRLGYFGETETTPEELYAFGDEIYDTITTAISEDPPFRPGDKQCHYCPNSGSCPVQQRAALALMEGEFDSFDEPVKGNVEALDVDEVEKAYENEEFVRHWLKATRVRLMELIDRGEKSKYKLVEGMKGHRKFKDEVKTIRFLQRNGLEKSSCYARKLISPAQVERLLPDLDTVALAKLVTRPKGRPLIVSADDPRKPYAPGLEEFESFDDEDET